MEEDGEHAAARESGNSGEDIGCLPLLQQEGSPLLSRPVQALASRAADEATTPQPRRMAILLNRLRVLLLCILYLGIGPSLILINRTILKERHFPLPMALSGLGLLFSSAVSSVLVAGRCVRLEHREVVTWPFFLRNIAPVGAAMATTLASGNAVYLYLPVSFIQMLKAFTPTVTLTLLYVSGIETPTRSIMLCVLGICAGTALASVGEGTLHVYGLSLMLLAEVSEAIRLVLTQKLLKNLKFGVIEGQYFLAPISALWLFSAAGCTELPKAMDAYSHLHGNPDWHWHRRHGSGSSSGSTVINLEAPLHEPWLFCLSAVVGFLVNIATFLVIKATNSVTLKVLGTARNAGLVLVSSWLYKEAITPLEGWGYAISLLFFAAYNYCKIYRM